MNIFKKLEHYKKRQSIIADDLLAVLEYNGDQLIPAIAQQHDTREVLMMAWMNRTAVEQTLATGQAHYWSRSRQKLWRKGETSGHTQKLIEFRLDCDGDCILLIVDQQGPACHTNRSNCFYNILEGKSIRVDSDPV